MGSSERVHLGETPAYLGTDYLAGVVGRRGFVSPHDRADVIAFMQSHFASTLADRVAEATAVVAGLRPAEGKSGRFTSSTRSPSGHELLALGEGYWYTEDSVFVRVFCELLDRWASTASSRTASSSVRPWERTSRVFGWSMGMQFMLTSSFVLEKDATRLLDGLGREGRTLASWVHAHRKPSRDRAAALAGLGFLGLLYPEAFGDHDWFEQGLGELAWCARDYLDPSSGLLTPYEALQVYVPLVALSVRNELDVPGAVLAGLETTTRALAHARARTGTSSSPLLPMLPAGDEGVSALRVAATTLLGRNDREPRFHEAEAGLVFLLGLDAMSGGDDDIERGTREARVFTGPFLDTAGPAA